MLLRALISIQSQLLSPLNSGEKKKKQKLLEDTSVLCRLRLLRSDSGCPGVGEVPMATETLEPVTRQQQELEDLLRLSLLGTPAPLSDGAVWERAPQ